MTRAGVWLGAIGILCLGLAVAGCHESDCPSAPEPDPLTIRELLHAPDTLRLDNLRIALAADLWRDFMPPGSDDGGPLSGALLISELDQRPLPTGSEVIDAWVICSGELWEASLAPYNTPGHPTEVRPDRLFAFFRDGPKWGPGTYADVVVRLRVGTRRTFLLRASDQLILRIE